MLTDISKHEVQRIALGTHILVSHALSLSCFMTHANIRKALKAMISHARAYRNLCVSYILPVKPMQGGRQLLDVEYADGQWDYLRNVNELPRFSVVVGYCHHYKDSGRILEIGCGEGVLQEKLCPVKYSRFVGVDISETAIQRARSKQNEKIRFVAEDAAVFAPGERFDVIVFNECLEYFEDPLRILRRYEDFLAQDGLFIISMYVGIDSARSKKIWKKIESLYNATAETRVSTQPRMAWNIKVFAPLQPDSASSRQAPAAHSERI